MLIRLLFVSLFILAIAACSNNTKVEIVGVENESVLVGESVGLVLLVNTSISQVKWTQTQGEAVSFLSDESKVISFDIPSEGNYSFQVEYLDNLSNVQTLSTTFVASPSSPVYVNARLDHEANSQAKMSLQAFQQLPGSVSSIQWTQIEGPAVTLTDNEQLSLNFTAPFVAKDTLLTFNIEVTDDQGNSGSDVVHVLLEEETINAESFFNSGRFEGLSLADVKAFNSDSVYSDVLQDCVYSNQSTELCNLEQLPFLGSINPNPTTDEIMDRVLVSHSWMGQRLRDYLERVDTSNDIKNLLGATTSIVISYDIRPSFFWSGSGAIYLSASYFWVTPNERDTINTAQDFRSNFSDNLQFADPWRVTKDNDYAYTSPSIASREERPLEDSMHNLSRLLYHELAHANDYFPPRAWANASNNDFAWTYSSINQPDSTGLSNAFPLISQEMYELGDVMFQGVTATQTQTEYTPEEVANFFFPFEATNTYNYSTEREDYAMLAEEYMMTYRFGVLYDQGITGLAPDYLISTAERGRVGHERTKARAEYVIQNILPSINVIEASALIPSPTVLTPGISWWDALVIPTSGTASSENKQSISNTQRQKILLGVDRKHP